MTRLQAPDSRLPDPMPATGRRGRQRRSRLGDFYRDLLSGWMSLGFGWTTLGFIPRDGSAIGDKNLPEDSQPKAESRSFRPTR